MKTAQNRRLQQEGALLFDLDGTLIDTAADFRAVLHDMCVAHGIDPPSDREIHATVSSGARALTALAFSSFLANSLLVRCSNPDSVVSSDGPGAPVAADKLEALNEELLVRYAEVIQSSRATLYPGMESLLQKLAASRTPWGIVTNKPERFSVPLLTVLGLDSRCGVLICPEHVSQRKPHPEALLLACEKLDRNPQHSIYVGDHPRDIEAGNAAGMLTIAAAYGYLPEHPPLAQWGADLTVQNAEEIYHYIESSN